MAHKYQTKMHLADERGLSACGHGLPATRTKVRSLVTCAKCQKLMAVYDRKPVAPIFTDAELGAIERALAGKSYAADPDVRAWDSASVRLAQWRAQ